MWQILFFVAVKTCCIYLGSNPYKEDYQLSRISHKGCQGHLSSPLAKFSRAVYKSGTGTRGRGHRDACVGTWDLGTRDEGLEDIKYGTRGRVGRGRGDVKYRDAGDAECE